MTRLETLLYNKISEANACWEFWQDGEEVVLGVSGGKDSLALLELLQLFPIKIIPVHIQNDSSTNLDWIKDNPSLHDCQVISTEIFKEIAEIKNPCFSCSRKRRKLILEFAQNRGVTKIVFAHHKNDVVETLLLNQFFSREISTMLPKQPLFKGIFHIIRPLYLVEEELIIKYASQKGFPIFKNPCRMETGSKRKWIKKLLSEINSEHPKIDVYDNIFSSIFRVNTDFMPKIP